MKADNARRVTGPSVLDLAGPCAAIEWLYDERERADPGLALALHTELRDLVARIGPAFGIGVPTLATRAYVDGSGCTVALGGSPGPPGLAGLPGLPGLIDRLYALVDWLEWVSLELADGRTFFATEHAVARAELAQHKWADLLAQPGGTNPALLALEAAADAHGVPLIWDDEHVSLGWGPTSRTWVATDLPALETLDFREFSRIPVAMVTGTNGKTTTTRMVARILRHAGLHVGASSTDGITVDEVVVEPGDWSGPGAARTILRRNDVEVAVLETARGGILRRGLGIGLPDRHQGAEAAIVTNIGADHFGEFGVTTLAEMAAVKSVVWKVVLPGGSRVVNVDDPTLAARVLQLRDYPAASWVPLSLDPEQPLLQALRANGNRVWFVSAGHLVTAHGELETAVVAIADIPATFHGTAVHNIYNALGAAALAVGLGIALAAVRSGLESFGRVPDDNPGRLEHYLVDGVHVVLDFGHNAHGIHAIRGAIGALVAQTDGARLVVSLGQAGDRSEADMAGLAAEVAALSPHTLFSRPVRGYERGRELMEVPHILHANFAALGFSADHNHLGNDEVAILEASLAEARPGDVILTLVHLEREAVRLWLAGKNSGK